MLTVVIPAHQESAVIGACLSSLVRQDCEPGVQVVVVANGCTDGTAAVAQTYADALAARGLSLEVLVLPRAGKPAALNAGDARATHGDRVYVDADVELSDNALSSIARAFAAGVDFCGPTIVPHAQTYFGRVYGRVWRRLPYVADDVVGAGLYAVSGRGRERWGAFPDIVADDKFARLHFDRTERVVLEDASFDVHLPWGFMELVRVRSRWIRANRQLRREFAQLADRDCDRLAGVPRFLVDNVSLWRDVPAFALVYGCAEIRSWITEKGSRKAPLRWERASGARLARENL